MKKQLVWLSIPVIDSGALQSSPGELGGGSPVSEREGSALLRSLRSDGKPTRTAHPCRAASHGTVTVGEAKLGCDFRHRLVWTSRIVTDHKAPCLQSTGESVSI